MSTTFDLSDVRWVKSSYSGNGGGSCLEWAPDLAVTTGVVPVRDSKVLGGPCLTLSPRAFATFVEFARSFDA
ncbi:DUF397 domain-containing protein [Streptomyces acidiscabies]|uniref:DUF397 domain-containing protein n=1 Tax=Streptomyces acidiscabies TaxID=42234 RepID=A0AAP6BJ98_9ACTN|nr:DUF397 domain-containing protein [Streptomyces acidiscabies]MBP5938175.1 DUF397 domain-containing protein [Streptomyces sp. LBUM 1476]MBZ3909191.1 DUF397 domain-containing protein [Streptomyces acidiscabies]MDX2965757.1 DUF397 domain-containing protein [Streptomyces acidiscabies]MDX3016402.1 DUF397 domain-containing protein [Streptomyces acidiscabies]MDX3788692.1 DUF397 domain-containing protein [Streptomyces acidiscabies]